MQRNATLQHQVIDGVAHVVTPSHKFGASDQPTGTAPDQSVWDMRGDSDYATQRLDKAFITSEIKKAQEQHLTWRAGANRYTEQDYVTGFPEKNRAKLQLQLQRLRAIYDETRGFVAGAQAQELGQYNGAAGEDFTKINNKWIPLVEVTNFQRSASELAKKFHLARILNYYDDHFAGSDGQLDPTVRALFLCETGFKQRGDEASHIDISSPFEPDELRLIKRQACIIDAKFLLEQYGQKSYLDTVEAMGKDIKESRLKGHQLEGQFNELEQHAKRIGKIMPIRAVEPNENHGLSDALLALSLYPTKKDLVGVEGDEKAAAAVTLCNGMCDVSLSRTTSLRTAKENLVALASSKESQCLKTSRTIGRRFLNQLWGKALFFLAAIKWVVKGSYHWQTDGVSKRKNLENAIADNSFAVMQTIQANKQPVAANMSATAA